MNIAIRVDASNKIGTGHFMRCLTLADVLNQRGAQIHFICRHLPEHLGGMLMEKNHGLTRLDSALVEAAADDLAHADWLGVSQQQDAQDTVAALSYQTWDWLVVDHYALDAQWESALRQTASKLLAVDDIADRQHDCDVLLDQNFYADKHSRYTGKVPEHCMLLLGPRYALLRDQFRQLRKQTEPRTGTVKRVLIFFGGVDEENYTGLALQTLADMAVPDMDVDVVIGTQHPCRTEIEAACVQHGFACHVQTSRMAELMAQADLCIGAGGIATWERCCLGLPTIAMPTAENQRRQTVDAASSGLLVMHDEDDDLGFHIKAMMDNEGLRESLSRNGMQAVDGLGASRVAGRMGCSGIQMRTATIEDTERLFTWRNHPAIRQVSRNADEIKREDHNRWIAIVLSDPNRPLLIGECNGSPVGVVRFDIDGTKAEVSIYLIPDGDNTTDGWSLLQTAERWLSVNRPQVVTLQAEVLETNERSQRLFLASGYQPGPDSYSKRVH
jgi:UDP-2,4-diacetamido-2,4,6-trideoxy-beta-L-altropyranose hydrolase